ncbi:MAG TPA: HlyD family efflux transporter periplasmic adaptor subunit, partial [Anaerolineae bacterium]|nr:HlyD family efflux transporter periplasmic adaptor subunit [Anaerolineae bacterium]
MKKLRKWIVLGVVVVVIAAAAVIITNNQRSAAQAAALANVQFGRVTRATLLSTIDSSGSVSPESKLTLSFGSAGTVAKVNVQPGDRVKKGDVLAQIDTTSLELQVAQAQQSLLIQQASYSMTIQPDPAAITSALLSLSSASANYKLAQQKFAVSNTDQVYVSCNGLDNAKRSYDDAVTAYNMLLANWRAVVNGSYLASPQKSQLDRAKANYDQAVSTCDSAKSNVNDSSVKSAYASYLQAKTNYETLLTPSERTLVSAQLQLAQAESAYEQAQQNLADAAIVAPLDGVVTQVNATVGGPAVSSGVVLLADVSHYHVNVFVDETEIGQVKVGQKVQVTFDALVNVNSACTVKQISPAGTISQGVVNYLVRVDLDPLTATLRLDMTSNVRVVIDTHANVLAVPGGAVRS